MKFVNMQIIIPQIVGTIIEINVHFKDFVSALIERQVVEQGQCISIKSMVFIAVI